MTQKYGADAIGLSRVLRIANTTAWNILHKLRRTMIRAEREMPGPVVEVDETYIGGEEKGKKGRGAEKKSLVVAAVELSADRKRLGRTRLAKIPDASSNSLLPFTIENVAPGSTVVTDGWSGYAPLSKVMFKHEVNIMADDKELLPHVHRIFGLVKRWFLGTFQGGIQHKYLDYYLDEYVFRFNRRKSRSRGKLFMRLIEQAVITPPITRKDLKIETTTDIYE
jgi:transposase-like protein